MQRKWLYFTVLVCAAAGLAWFGWNGQRIAGNEEQAGLNVCMFRHLTGMPCPSCGSTRSVMAISQLAFREAFLINPIGFIIALAMVVFPVWVIYDLACRKDTFLSFYGRVEHVIRTKWVAAVLIGLMAINWAWNIYKFT